MNQSVSSTAVRYAMVLLAVVLTSTSVFAQVSSYQVGGPFQQVGHDVTLQSNFANCADTQDTTPGASITVTGPPCPLDSTIDNKYGSGSASTSTNFGQSGSTLSFSAHSAASASSVDPSSIYGGMHAFATQGGSYYSFVLDHSSYVEFNATFNPSFSGNLASPGKGSAFANISVNAGSPGGGIPRDSNNVAMQLFGSVTGSGSLNSVTVHTAPVLLGPGIYYIQGGTSATADTGQSASADVSVSVSVQASNLPDPIGSFTCADGTVTITAPGGSPVAASIGMPVHMGDVINTGQSGSRACVLLNDNTTFIISTASRLTVDQYVYDPNNTVNNSARYSIAAQAFQYVSGLVSKRPDPDVQINTPVGQIGIRGTELIGTNNGTSQTILLAEGEISVTPSHTATPGIYDAQTVITFDSNGASTSSFSQDAYDQLKTQITGVSTADTQAPTIQCAAAPTGWQSANVTISCSASDSGSGLANTADASFTLSTSVAANTETANASTSSHQVCDKATNCATAGPISGIMIDLKAPTITITTPAKNGSWLLNAAVASNYQCVDRGSGVQSCAGPVASGTNIDTATVGAKSFTVNAKDNVGNTSNASANYTVTFGVCLLFDNTRAIKSGSTVPIRLALCDANNNDVSASSNLVHAMSLVQVSNNASYNIEDAGSSNSDSDFRFDPTVGSSGGYIFNLRTTGMTTGTYVLSFTAGTDPTTHSVSFQVR